MESGAVVGLQSKALGAKKGMAGTMNSYNLKRERGLPAVRALSSSQQAWVYADWFRISSRRSLVLAPIIYGSDTSPHTVTASYHEFHPCQITKARNKFTLSSVLALLDAST